MTDYISFDERHRRNVVRNVALASIAAIYLVALTGALLGDDIIRWSLIGLAIIAPPLIEFRLPKPVNTSGVEIFSPHLQWLLLSASIVIPFCAGLIYGSEQVRQVLIWAAAAIGTLAAVGGLFAWVTSDSTEQLRRILMLLIFTAVAALIIGAAVGSPIVRWISIGSGSAFLVAVFRRDGNAYNAPEDHGWAVDRNMMASQWARDAHDAWRPSSSATMIPPELQSLDSILASAYQGIQHLLHDERQHERSYQDWSAVMLSIAALNNIHYIPTDMARSFASAVRAEPSDAGELATRQGIIRQLMDEIDYARARLRAHGAGAPDPALTAGLR